ncbi:hypothetical protein NUM3379_21180 [Kineococcus sp. NUM-3379]
MAAATTIPGYGLAAPTLADVRAAVARAGGDVDGTWAALCATAGVDPAAAEAGPDGVAALVAAVRARGGVLGVLGRSLWVRLETYRALARTAGTDGAQDADRAGGADR